LRNSTGVTRPPVCCCKSRRDGTRIERVGVDPIRRPAPGRLNCDESRGGLRLRVRGSRVVGPETKVQVIEDDWRRQMRR
jgi:hypothetical protein